MVECERTGSYSCDVLQRRSMCQLINFAKAEPLHQLHQMLLRPTHSLREEVL